MYPSIFVDVSMFKETIPYFKVILFHTSIEQMELNYIKYIYLAPLKKLTCMMDPEKVEFRKKTTNHNIYYNGKICKTFVFYFTLVI